MKPGRLSFSFQDEPDKVRIMTAILCKLGYTVERARPEMVTVGELARMTGRNPAALSRTLRKPNCPSVATMRGKRRTLRIAATEELVRFLAVKPTGGRPRNTP